MINLSKLQFYSYGLAIADNIENDKIIKIYPIEKMYTEGGNIAKEDKLVTTLTGKFLDIQPKADVAKYIPNKEDIELMHTKYIIAEWINLTNSNRLTPPNVGKGENIIIFRYSKNDMFFWDTIQTDLKLRKEEHVIHSYSDKPALDEEEDELEDRYYVMFSPKNKEVKIHTGKKYGEFTDYDITIKTDEGFIKINDGMGNSITLDSPTSSLNINTNLMVNVVSATTNILSGLVNIKSDRCNIN